VGDRNNSTDYKIGENQEYYWDKFTIFQYLFARLYFISRGQFIIGAMVGDSR